MEKKDWLAKSFEETRDHLKAVAFRMLGSADQAEDAVPDAWMRLARSESENIENLRGWLTTVVARVCLDMLRSRKSRSEEPLDTPISEIPGEDAANPDTDLLIADSVGPALLVVIDQLTPPERIAFVLHDLFDLSFEEIAPILDRTEAATRQLASRARRRVRGASTPQEDVKRQQEVVSAFLAASREGNFEALIELLHPDAILLADETAMRTTEANKSKGAPQFKRLISGAKNVAEILKGSATAAQLVLIDGTAGAVWPPKGKPAVAFCFTLKAGRISTIEIVMDRKRLEGLNFKTIHK